MNLPKGVYVPMITPFRKDSETLDAKAIENNAARLAAAGVAGLMPLGSNGEFRSLSDDESLEVIKSVLRAVPKGITVMCGVSRESAFQTLAFIDRVAALGIQAVFVLTPCFFQKSVGEAGLLRYYEQIAQKSPIPILLYTAPSYSGGVELPGEVVRIMAQHPNCIGMKDSSPLPTQTYAPYASDKFRILAGSQANLFQWMQAGAVGGVLSAANYAPEVCVRLMKAYQSAGAEEIHPTDAALKKAGKTISGQFGVSGVKAAASLCGFDGGVARNPCPVLGKEELSVIEAELKTLHHAVDC